MKFLILFIIGLSMCAVKADVLECQYSKTGQPFVRVKFDPESENNVGELTHVIFQYAKDNRGTMGYYTKSQHTIINWTRDSIVTSRTFRPAIYSFDAFDIRETCHASESSCSYSGKDYDAETDNKFFVCNKVVSRADSVSDAVQATKASEDQRIECGADLSCPSGYKCKVEWRPGPFYCERR